MNNQDQAPRPYTEDEVRDQILDAFHGVVDFWARCQDPDLSTRDRLNGVAFSILSTLDGSSHLPAFDLVPCPHETDREYHIELGENYWDPETRVSTQLHEFWHRGER